MTYISRFCINFADISRKRLAALVINNELLI